MTTHATGNTVSTTVPSQHQGCFRLDGFQAVVLGEANDIGRAVMGALSAAGAQVIAGSKLASAHRSTPEVKGLGDVAAAISHLPSLDLLINVVALPGATRIASVSEVDLDDCLERTVRDCFLVSQAAVRKMLDNRGARQATASIIHVTSPLAQIGAANRSLSCMAMHAIRGLTAAMAVELGPLGIRINTLERTLDTDVSGERALREFVTPESLAASVVYLASPAAAGMTGAGLCIDAGWTAR